MENNSEFSLRVHKNEGERFASVEHLPSGCGADLYATNVEIEWQDNNGLFSNCSPEIVEHARKAAREALASE